MADYPRSLGPALRPLEELLGDPAVTSVHVNGPDDVWVRVGERIERVDVELSAGKVRVLADAIARAVEADDDQVRFGQRFPEGLSVTVVRPPAAVDGPVITLSRPPAGPPTVDDMISRGGLSGDALARIGKAFDDGLGVLVAGSDETARRALLVALASALRDSERVVFVDEGSVHPPDLQHLVRLRVSNAPGASRTELIKAAADLGADRVLLDAVGPDDVLSILLDAGDAYAGVVFAAPGATVEAAVDRLLCIARGAASTGDPAPLIPATLGLVVVASGGGAEPRVAEIGEINADPATGAPALRLLFRRSDPGGDLAPTEIRSQGSATTRTPALDVPQDLPRGFRTTRAPAPPDDDPEADPPPAEEVFFSVPPPVDETDTHSDLPPPPVFDPSAPSGPDAAHDEPVSEELPDAAFIQAAPPREATPAPAPFDERTNIIRMVPQELLDLEE